MAGCCASHLRPPPRTGGKRICFVNTLPRAYRYFLRPQMQALAARGHDVTFVSNWDAQLATELQTEFRYEILYMRRGVEVFEVPIRIIKLFRIFKKGAFDIIQYSGPNAAFYSSIAAWMARIPVRIYAQWGIRYVGYSGIRRWMLKQVERITCCCSTVIQPDSHGNLIFSLAERLYPSAKANVIWNGSACGVDLHRFDITQKTRWRAEIRGELNVPPEAFVLGFVGALRRDKGLNELIRAARELQESTPSLWLLLVGDKELFHTIDFGQRQWLKTASRVTHVSATPEVPKYMSAMDLLVLPSYREGFGMVVVEAAALGIPSIVSAIPGPLDAVIPGETGLVVPKGEWRPIVRAVERLMSDTRLYGRLSRNSRNYVESRFEQRELMRRFCHDKERLLTGERCRKSR